MVSTKKKNLRILMVATEAAPYASVGGAGSVTGHLSKTLVKLGYDVSLFIPKFGFIEEQKYPMKMEVAGLKIPTNAEGTSELVCNVKSYKNDSGVTIYFLENQEYYEKRANVYGYSDDPVRFLLLAKGALEFIRTGVYVPDIIHCHDWHTGSLPNLLRTVYKKDPILENIATLFTIHNLAFQGTFDHKHVTQLDYDDGKSQIADFFSPRLSNQNFMRRGILYSDVVNTVSKTYSKEILTPEFGEGLDKLLLELRGKIFGIVNGIDYDEFNPATDDLIEQTFSADSLDLRAINKKALQREFDLPVNPNAFLLGFVGRLDYMKGVDLLVHSLYPALKEFDMQFVQVGGGDWSIVEMLQNLKRDFPKQVGIHTFPNFTLPRLLFSGCDSIVYPSRFEPCGIVQIEAMRYGAVPVVRKVGGLADTVENFHSDTLKGNGFIFDYFNEFSLFGQLIRASELFKNKEIWHQLQKNAMQSDFSWEYSAREYVKLYEKVYAFKHNKSPREKSLDYDLLM